MCICFPTCDVNNDPDALMDPDLEYKTKPVSKVQVNFTLILERIFIFDNEKKFCARVDGSIHLG